MIFRPDERHFEIAMAVEGSALCSYLIGLAAVQRRLNVSFETYLGDKSKSFHKQRPDYSGAYMRISSAKRSYFFDRSRGEKSFAVANNVGAFKDRAKAIFAAKGIQTPRGRKVSGKAVKLIGRHFGNDPSTRLIAKPAAGSLGAGVILDKSPEELIDLLSPQKGDWIVEEMIVGPEYRVFVVGEHAIAAFERLAPYVIGDGKRSIKELVEAHNEKHALNPHSKGSRIDFIAAAAFLSEQGRTLDDTPKYLEKVALNQKKFAPGRHIKDVTDAVPDAVKQEAVKAVKAVGLPNGGVDVLFDSQKGEPFVLEVNPRAHIGGHTFPTIGAGQGNKVANAILDHYFPETAGADREENFVLDFTTIQSTLATSVVERVSPMTPKTEWIKRPLALDCSVHEAERIVEMLRLIAIYVNWYKRADGDNMIDAYFHKTGLKGFTETYKKSKIPVVTREVDKMIVGKG